jgi:hypothetical protein
VSRRTPSQQANPIDWYSCGSGPVAVSCYSRRASPRWAVSRWTISPIARTESGEVPPTPFVLRPITAMEAEHDDAGRALAEMRRLTGGYAVPAGGCNAYRAAMAGLSELEADMHAHVLNENTILYLRAARLAAGDVAGR